MSADLDDVVPPSVLFCAECDGRPFAVTETMHDAEAEMAIHYATHGRYGHVQPTCGHRGRPRARDRAGTRMSLVLVPEEPLAFLTVPERVELNVLAELQHRGVDLAVIRDALDALIHRATDPPERTALRFLRGCIEEDAA